ncbi:MAG: DUF86 domain-containing protein [Chitinophagales bacterium]|nr:DUF86 domain-containing protein [Chitinophagales bacterium]
MSEDILVWLHDIKKQIVQIEEFYVATEKSFEEFKRNTMLRKAIECNLEIAAEALNRILEKQPDFPVSNARKIIGFRNRLAHEYDKLDDETVYSITILYLPQLLEEVDKVLETHKP